MDPQTKSAIKSLVLDLRHTLEDELTIVLRRYGLFTDREWSLEEPPARLTDPADREIWHRIVAVVQRGMKGHPSASGGPGGVEGRTLPQASALARASADYVRESAFTFLNRLVGLKCLEVRGIIDEVITTRDIYGGRSKAHRDYRDEHPRQARAADDALPACLEAVCQRVNDEMIGYLFDPDDDHSLVWPRYAVLRDCIERINALDESVWKEDEIIGWIYQFYNAEEKVAIRKRGKPRTPHDVAVINQFFTPRWIVKFLVDNTLGRLWLEMHPESERVRVKCDYLVPEPLPNQQISKSANRQISRSVDQQEGGGQAGEVADLQTCRFALDPASPINNPHAPPRREEKPITQIRLLDPACGTMHFGHYACEVFEAMYRDARDWGHVEIADREIPTAILEHNLFGVDIDRRAVQLAALSLFMKARTMHPQARVRQVNLVVADATLPDSGIKEQFLARYANDKAVQRAFAQVLDDMDNVAQVGSLLRVEERLRDLLASAGHAAARERLDTLRRQRELPGMEPPVRQMGLAELVEEEQAAEWTPHYTLQEMRDDLRAFARQALDEHDLNAQLFATEADKAVRLLDVLMAKYDVVVMNPPFGYPLASAAKLINKLYEDWCGNLLCAFYIRALSLLGESGYIGTVSDKTFAVKKTYAPFRERYFLAPSSLVTFLDLGWDVLDDASVEVCSLVADKNTLIPRPFFIDLQEFGEKESTLERVLVSRNKNLYLPRSSDLRRFPFGAFGYKAPDSILKAFGRFEKIADSVAYCPSGGLDAPAGQYYRYHWEVPCKEIGPESRYALFWNGGTGFSPYYATFVNVLSWHGNGSAVAADPRSNIRLRDYYFKPGVAWGKRGHFLHVCWLDNAVFSKEGQQIFPYNESHIWPLMAFLNSEVARYSINLFCGQHKYGGYVGQLPFAEDALDPALGLGNCAQSAYDFKTSWDTANEICTRFTAPWLLQVCESANQRISEEGIGKVLALLGEEAPEVALPDPPTLAALLDAIRAIETAADARLQHLQAEIDEAVYDLYEISPADRRLIERELGDRPPELVWPQLEGRSDKEKRREHVRRLFSYYARQAVREDEDGIVPLAGCAAREPYLIDRVRARLEADFGPQAAYQLEQDAADYIGRPLEEWLHRYFFHRFHARLYKKRPILWHLTSPRRYFAVLLDYHRLTRDTLPKVQSLYLWPQMEEVRTRLAAGRAAADGASVKAIADLEDELADLEDCNARLESVIQGTVEVDLPEWANGPYRGGAAPYDPDLDDGVKVNLLPVQEAGLLPVKKVV